MWRGHLYPAVDHTKERPCPNCTRQPVAGMHRRVRGMPHPCVVVIDIYSCELCPSSTLGGHTAMASAVGRIPL